MPAGSDRIWSTGEENGTTEDEMVGWDHRLNGHDFEQTQGDSEGHGRLVRCSLWGCKESQDRATNMYLLYVSVAGETGPWPKAALDGLFLPGLESPVQCHESHSIVHQALYLSDLGP